MVWDMIQPFSRAGDPLIVNKSSFSPLLIWSFDGVRDRRRVDYGVRPFDVKILNIGHQRGQQVVQKFPISRMQKFVIHHLRYNLA